jgi:hypothetical protein
MAESSGGQAPQTGNGTQGATDGSDIACGTCNGHEDATHNNQYNRCLNCNAEMPVGPQFCSRACTVTFLTRTDNNH